MTALNWIIYRKMGKIFVFGEYNKNVNFSTKFQFQHGKTDYL